MPRPSGLNILVPRQLEPEGLGTKHLHLPRYITYVLAKRLYGIVFPMIASDEYSDFSFSFAHENLIKDTGVGVSD
jgi:hypothetical protein